MTPRPVAVEVGRYPRTRTVYRVFASIEPGGAGCWLTTGSWWWRNDRGGKRPRFATFSTKERAEDAIRSVLWPEESRLFVCPAGLVGLRKGSEA